jgi:hypothetical protein
VSPTPEDITDALREENRGAAMDAVLGLPKKAKAAPAAPAAAPAAPAQPSVVPVAAPAAPNAPQAVKIRTTPPKPAASLSAEDVARISANTVAEFTRQQKASEPPPASPDDGLPEDLKRLAPVYQEMERMFPDKYKGGIAQKVAKFREAELRRADDWESKHPGQIYNAEDDEHADFYEKNQPRIDAEDVEEARFEVRYKQRYQRDVEPQIKEAQRTTQMMRSEPEARNVAEAAAGQIATLMLPEGVKADEASLKKWAEEDPIAAEISTEVAQQVKPVVHSMSLLWDGVQKFDERNEAHVRARELLSTFEAELSQADPEQLVDSSGRQWVPLAQYNQLSERDRARAYTTTKTNLANYASIRAAEFAKNATKQRREIAEKYAQRMGYSKTPASPAAQAQPQQPAQQPIRINSPSVGGGAPTPPSSGAAPVGGAPAKDPIDRMLGL